MTTNGNGTSIYNYCILTTVDTTPLSTGLESLSIYTSIAVSVTQSIIHTTTLVSTACYSATYSTSQLGYSKSSDNFIRMQCIHKYYHTAGCT